MLRYIFMNIYPQGQMHASENDYFTSNRSFKKKGISKPLTSCLLNRDSRKVWIFPWTPHGLIGRWITRQCRKTFWIASVDHFEQERAGGANDPCWLLKERQAVSATCDLTAQYVLARALLGLYIPTVGEADTPHLLPQLGQGQEMHKTSWWTHAGLWDKMH